MQLKTIGLRALPWRLNFVAFWFLLGPQNGVERIATLGHDLGAPKIQ
jgi:hypothetical protein